MQHMRDHWSFDGYHVHGSEMQRGGEPDIDGSVILSSDRWGHLKVEVKTPIGLPTPRQLYRLREYHKRGYVVGIVTSVDEMQQILLMYRAVYCGMPFKFAMSEVGLVDRYGLWG